MHCADVIEELAVSAELVSAAVAEHLASCPDCAARDARLSQLWEATRPQEPTPKAWATFWADLTHTLATPPAPVVPLAPMRPWQRWVPATFGIAQAAAFLAGAVWLGSQPSPTPLAFAKVEIPASTKVEIPASDGALVLIQSSGTDVNVVSLVADDGATAVDPSFVMLGKLEAMAE